MLSTRTKIIDAKETYQKYLGLPLTGIYNVVDKSIILFPCFTDRLELNEDENQKFISGKKITKYDMIISNLTDEELAECNRLGYAARFIYLPTINPLTGYDFLSAHEFVTRLMGANDLKTLGKYRGFTVTQNDLNSEPTFDWKSGSLNSPRHENGELIERIRGCEMIPSLRKEVEDIITPWSKALKVKQEKSPKSPNAYTNELKLFNTFVTELAFTHNVTTEENKPRP